MRRGDQESALWYIERSRTCAASFLGILWVRGRMAKEDEKTYLFGCTVLEEVEGA
jgi:hypothetical protein